MARRKSMAKDPVLPDQGGRETPVDPGRDGVEDTVRCRAYELFERRGMKHGYDLQDWFDAEAQLRAETVKPRVHARSETPDTLVAT